MIVVTGTMRSGTSMWMQILQAAGFPVIGAEFPGKWKERIGEANEGGFYESVLREGIYYRTNPHPRTGHYLAPAATRRHAVKVFAQGLVRSDVAFLDRVLLTIRPFRQYAASFGRLMEMERRARSEEQGRELPLPPHLPHALHWWDDNFSAFRDALVRGYPTHAIAYDTVLEDPAALKRTLGWLGAQPEQIEAALQVVDEARRTQRQATSEEPPADEAAGEVLDADAIAVFDELYDRVRSSRGFDEAFIARMNALDARLSPVIGKERRRVQRLKRLRLIEAHRTTRGPGRSIDPGRQT